VHEQIRRLRNDKSRRRCSPIDTSGVVLSYRQPESLNLQQQETLHERCEKQNWVGISDVILPEFGRCLVSTQKFKKDDVIVDYHGRVVEGVKFEDYIAQTPSANENFCMEIKHRPSYIIDATSEHCVKHPGHRCLGRFANHADSRRGVANIASTDVILDLIPGNPRVVVFRALRDIQPFTQLRFDYVDPVARALYKEKE